MRFLLLLLVATGAFGQAPRLFFTDLTSGPNTGGETSGSYSGAYVTLYGNEFGSSQGASTVTLNGANCMRVVSWGTAWLWYQKIVVQLGSSCTTGNLVVTTSSGTSNSIAFTVRSGNIYFASTTGNDSTGTGSFSSPWATIPKCAHSMAAGDICYILNGVVDNSDDGFGSPLNLDGENGTAGHPKALLVYPGASATIGGNATSRGIIQYPSTSSYWVLSGFLLQNTGVASGSSGEALHLYEGSANWEIVGNTFTCPLGDGFTGCVTTDGAPFVDFLGNTIHNTGATGADKTYHAFYFGDHGTTGNQAINVGWNSVYDIRGCRGIMFHSIDSTPGAEGYNLQIHDNLVHDTQCDGIALANVNPDKGAIIVYNNVEYHVGTGPDPQGQGANYSCIYTGDTNGSPVTPVDVYNNTCYDGGSRGASEGDAGAFTAFIPTKLRNNIVYELSGEAYLTASTISTCPACITGSANIWYGVGNGPSQTTGNLNVNPLLVNPAGTDFHLQSSSPAKDAGVTISGLLTDHDGLSRPQGSAYDMGAYEYASGTTSAGASLAGKASVSGSASIH